MKLATIAAVAAALALLAQALAAPTAPVPFRTLAHHFGGGYAAPEEPTVLFALNRRQARLVPLAPGVTLAGVGFPSRVAIAVYRGSVPTCGYAVTARTVTSAGGRVLIVAELGEPGPGDVVCQAFTAPYHVVVVRRADLLRATGSLPRSWTLVDTAGAVLASGPVRRG